MGEKQKGVKINSVVKPLDMGWGSKDKVCFSKQAKRAIELFPDGQLHWFKNREHFPHRDAPQQTIELILKTAK